jgi:hypothetical protein
MTPALSSFTSSSAPENSGYTPVCVPEGKFTKTMLPPGFVPSQYAVICGRGKSISNAKGNQHLKILINSYLRQYSDASNRLEKSTIVSTIVATIKQASPSGGFVKLENGCWYVLIADFSGCFLAFLFTGTCHLSTSLSSFFVKI